MAIHCEEGHLLAPSNTEDKLVTSRCERGYRTVLGQMGQGSMMGNSPAKTHITGDVIKASDLRAHVRVVDVDGMKVVEIRDYIPSLKEYGRGYWLPLSEAAIYGVIAALQEVADVEDLA